MSCYSETSANRFLGHLSPPTQPNDGESIICRLQRFTIARDGLGHFVNLLDYVLGFENDGNPLFFNPTLPTTGSRFIQMMTPRAQHHTMPNTSSLLSSSSSHYPIKWVRSLGNHLYPVLNRPPTSICYFLLSTRFLLLTKVPTTLRDQPPLQKNVKCGEGSVSADSHQPPHKHSSMTTSNNTAPLERPQVR